ncbi:MAG: Cof-type HAD-IIB family hydrolase [Coriobacteriales bacterium]|nr:Cof-type HAD-IIB family hydrolase [Coriobacteriales bacterium]
MQTIKMVAVDMDGTMCRGDHRFDEPRFRRVLERIVAAGCKFVVASGNQYWQLRDFFPGYDEELSFVAENGSYVKDQREVVFVGTFERSTVLRALDWVESRDDVLCIMSCLNGAFLQRGRATQEYADIMHTWYHRLDWVDDLRDVEDPVLKFALNMPQETTWDYFDRIRADLGGELAPTSSGHGAIDLIIPGCHKASGIERLAQRWGIDPADCAAFGDGENDIKMLEYVGHSYAMANAEDTVKAVAKYGCPSNEEEGVLTTLEQLFPE